VLYAVVTVIVFCVGRADVQPVANIMTFTFTLPLTAAGCSTLRGAVDKSCDGNGCTADEHLSSCVCQTLLQNTSMHAASLKHVLAALAQLVSSCFFHISETSARSYAYYIISYVKIRAYC